MKRIFALLLIALLMFSIGAESLRSTPGEFEIKAYKIGSSSKPFVGFRVVDALTGSLAEITANGIDIDGYYTLSSAEDTTKDNVNNVLFSYLVSGNVTGTFDVSVTVNPFTHQSESGAGSSIKAKYFLINETLRFLKSNNDTSADGYRITDISEGKVVVSDVLPSTTQNANALSDGFKIQKEESDVLSNCSEDTWMARGAVAVAIDSASYKDASNGEYRAIITVTLKSDDAGVTQ